MSPGGPTNGGEWRQAFRDLARRADGLETEVRDLKNAAVPVTIARIDERVNAMGRDLARAEREREAEAIEAKEFRREVRSRLEVQEARGIGDAAVARRGENSRSRLAFAGALIFGASGLIFGFLEILAR